MAKMILLVGAAVASGMLLYLFLRWERSGREHWVVFLLLGLLVFESTLWDNETTVPKGLFHPGTGSLEFRLPEVIISVAIVARLLTKGRPQRIGLPALLWVTVAAWWSLEAVEGVLRHNSLVKLPYEAKAIIYVMGAYTLASGVPIRRYLEGRGFQRLVRWSALAASLLLVLTSAHKKFALNIPLLRLGNFGSLGTDAATLFVSIGVIAFLVELNKDHRSRLNLLCTVPLAMGTFFAYQRAVLLTLGAVVTVVVLVALGSTARRRLRIRSGEVALAALAVVGVVLAVSVIPAITSQKSVTGPAASFATRVGNTLKFAGEAAIRPGPHQQMERGLRRRQAARVARARARVHLQLLPSGAEPIHPDRSHREHRPRPLAAYRAHRVGFVPLGPADLTRQRIRHVAPPSGPRGGGPGPGAVRGGDRDDRQGPGRIDLRELSACHGVRALARHAP